MLCRNFANYDNDGLLASPKQLPRGNRACNGSGNRLIQKGEPGDLNREQLRRDLRKQGS